ncbi:MAG: bifunctional phosphoribosylaminoimidazolecarboxamide formyltransferase/IMP cyclohydrolase PurH [Alphaproteobacteria bacterium]|nr:MAG: bifunctional phosphoribosylaminoimidazolecarboxamide formyltransferase/IMP cyclohydrolase PurH [Alphaproteobacteria bacterium]TAF15590.1 MAG: bifunctional phosphoribosylaminoimidazolecarboxamide formyltransferase/IMP cyclohydrolase PurH [Alphaproteobacteria bacterium]TAF41994.1 MAG: bifunctional phosphoribosylaminoimidazolecarboxamide formyltransferase/IMP cyclohydrolase PurH [Alphaproteobacteria bacterium]TAF76602.1 MAG: bifunctional phosphoribosylaminoimidazolecarboxamide formyltransfe
MNPTSIKTALLSVTDKTGLIPFAQGLARHHVRLLSTGGTARLLREAGLDVTDVSDHTGFPEMMDGRVKTLHPKVHGGILARRDVADDAQAMRAHAIEAIDLVVVNLYAFEATVARGADYAQCVENIDIGGPAMIRSAAKNHAHVTIVVCPDHYDTVLAEMDRHAGATSFDMRKKMAATAFAHTAHYDATISNWYGVQCAEPFPQQLTVPMTRLQALRYGENPHQEAAFYASGAVQGTLAAAQQLHGKELSFNNINDTDAAWALVCDVAEPAIAIIKHANPCGMATAKTMVEAYIRAFACDPQSAYGGIIAANRTVDAEAAKAIGKQFAEVVIAPDYTEEAIHILREKKNVRVLRTGALLPKSHMMNVRSVSGGYLIQTHDDVVMLEGKGLQHVTKRTPTAAQIEDMMLAFTVAKHVKSNAIILVKDGAVVGIGAGQMSRIDSVRIACEKAKAAGLSTVGTALASEAFFPFDDNVHLAAEAGVAAIIQPGGSIRDDDVIAAANQHDMVMSFTAIRHFKH